MTMQRNFFATNKADHPVLLYTPQIEDLHQLAKVAKKTYAETYPNLFNAEQLEEMFGENYIYLILPQQLNDPNCIWLLAKDKQTIMGYGKIIVRENNSALLDKLYVLETFHG